MYHYLYYYPPLEKGLISDPSFKQNGIEVYSLPQIFFMQSLVKIGLVGLVVQDKKFKMFVMYLHLLCYVFTFLPTLVGVALYLTNT